MAAFDPISSRISREDATEVGATARAIPARVQKAEAPTEMKVCRPQRFNNKGELTAVAGIPVGRNKAAGDADTYAEGTSTDLADYYGEALSGMERHVADMAFADDDVDTSVFFDV
jgi:hypothetical protein